MDRPETDRLIGESAVCISRAGTVLLLLRAWQSGKLRERGVDASDRPTLSAAAVLRVAAHDRLAGRIWLAGQRKAGGADDAGYGTAIRVAEAVYKPTPSGKPGLPIPVARVGHPGSEARLVCRYHLYSAARRASVSGRRDGLVQPVCAGLGVIQLDGIGVLHPGAESCVGTWHTGDIQHRSGRSVQQHGLYGPAEGRWRGDQHGWPGPGLGQRVHRAPLVVGQIRGSISRRLRQRMGGTPTAGTVLSVLQHRAEASVVGKTDALCGVLRSAASRRRAIAAEGGGNRTPSYSLKRKSPAPPALLRRAIQPILGSQEERGGFPARPPKIAGVGNHYPAWKQEQKRRWTYKKLSLILTGKLSNQWGEAHSATEAQRPRLRQSTSTDARPLWWTSSTDAQALWWTGRQSEHSEEEIA